MSTEITTETDCDVWAFLPENNVVLPSSDIPVKNMPPKSSYDGLLEGDGILKDYERVSAQMAELHDTWREATLEWSTRMDQLFAQIVVLKRTLEDDGSAPPEDDFEEFAEEILGFYIITFYGLGQGLWSVSDPLRRKLGFGKPRTATIGVQTTPTPSPTPVAAKKQMHRELLRKTNPSAAKVAATVSQGAKTSKMARVRSFAKGSGKALLAVGTLVSLGVIVIDIINRKKSMIEVIPKFQGWLYGYEDEAETQPIKTPDITTDDGIRVGGAAGRILEMQQAIAAIHDAIRTLARLEGVATETPDGTDRDMNLVFCEIRRIMDGRVRSASQVAAALDVTTRMLCIDHWTPGISYSDTQIADVTGIDAFTVGLLRSQVSSNPTALCPGVAPGSGG